MGIKKIGSWSQASIHPRSCPNHPCHLLGRRYTWCCRTGSLGVRNQARSWHTGIPGQDCDSLVTWKKGPHTWVLGEAAVRLGR